MKALTREWLEYAEHDLYAAKLLAESHKPPFEVIAYHCQQSAEKSIKALLIEHGEPLPRTHDMGVLCKLVTDFYDGFTNYLEDCDRLTPYGVITRYPGSPLSIGKEHVSQALNTAEKIQELANQYLSESST